jgi:hypothetical protein
MEMGAMKKVMPVGVGCSLHEMYAGYKMNGKNDDVRGLGW